MKTTRGTLPFSRAQPLHHRSIAWLAQVAVAAFRSPPFIGSRSVYRRDAAKR
jgi:hypothetical protein